LRSLSIKQGRKYDNPLSSREIKGFVEFHKLDLGEILLPLEEFKTYNPHQILLTSVSTNSSIVSLSSKHALARLQKIHQSPSHQLTVAVSFLTKLKRQRKYGSKEETSICNVSLAQRSPMKQRNMKVEHLEYLDWHLKIIIVSMFPWTEYSENPSWWRDSIILSTQWLLDLRTALMERLLIARLDVYGENIRVVVPIDTEHFGRVMVVCVGAMMVGSIVITAKKGQQVRRTDELGYFKFGMFPLFVLVDS
jgi:phosphatidylserine decarboxylase